MIREVTDITDLETVAKDLVNFASDVRCWIFEGEMGAGKTTLIKQICEVLGVEEVVSSPTFSLVNEYKTPIGSVYHFDFYRIKSEFEAFDMGAEDYFYSGEYCFIEWPSQIQSLLPSKLLKVAIRVDNTQKRIIEAKLIS